MGRRFTTSRFHAGKVHYVVGSRWCGAPIAWADAAAQLVEAEYEELPARVRRGRGDDLEGIVTRSSPPAPSDLSISRASATPTGARFPSADGRTSRAAMAQADHVFEHTFRTQQVRTPARAMCRSARRPPAHHHTARSHRSFVVSKIGACGWPENQSTRQGAVSRRRLRRQLYIKLERWWPRSPGGGGEISLTMESSSIR